LGEYTISVDFATLQPTRDKSKGGDLWYDDLLNAYFDDDDHFKTIKALCRLSCSVCVKAGQSGRPLPKGFVQPDTVFRDIERLRQHLFGIHKMVMCELCLEGRKVRCFAGINPKICKAPMCSVFGEGFARSAGVSKSMPHWSSAASMATAVGS
jgi:hypothetical protein